MELCNLMSGQGCGGFGPWAMVWLALGIVIMLSLILRRQCDDGVFAGTNFNFVGSLVVGCLPALLLGVLFASPLWTLLGGLIGIGIGGFALGFLGGGGYE
jgi:hypothetical protein